MRDAVAAASKLPRERKYLTREEFEKRRGADPADLRKLDEFARDHNLTIVETNVAARTVRLNGTVADLANAFNVKLDQFQVDDVRYRGRTGKVSVPATVGEVVEAVYGLDNRPVAKPHFRVLQPEPLPEGAVGAPLPPGAEPRNAPDGSFKVPELGTLYGFPAGLDGRGQCIALIELNDTDANGNPTGTGYKLSDIEAFFTGLGMPVPNVVSIGVDGGANVPGFSDADGEVVLDIEVAGALAPGAQIAVYFAPNTTAGFIDAINAALHDTVHKPSVISISWGGPEDGSPQQYLDGMEQAFQDAATLGVTVCCASGDNGSADMDPSSWDRKPHCDFPAASPFVLGCGGTKLLGSGNKITSEVVWNEGARGGATGGGVSNIFPKPGYQSKAGVPQSPKKKKGRGVPDVAGDADPYTGYQVLLNGQAAVFGGTSAVAPLWAGLLARINQRLKSKGGNAAGFLNPLLYGALLNSGALTDVTSGNNDVTGTLKGLYKAGKGWDACTGLGSPNGTKLLKALGG